MENISSRRLIHEAVRNLGNLYNVLYVYGSADKTAAFLEDLLQAIQRDRPDAKVVHTTGAAFCHQIGQQAVPMEQEAYLEDILIFEDLQAVAGRETAEQVLYGILDSYLEKGGQILVTGDAPLYEMLCLASRIQAQLLGGLSVQAAD